MANQREEQNSGSPKNSSSSNRGFASMDPEEQRITLNISEENFYGML